MRKKKKKMEEHADEGWLLPYSDMLTLLLALFIVMFAMAKVDDTKFKAVSNQFHILLSSDNSSGGEGLLDSEKKEDTKTIESKDMTKKENNVQAEKKLKEELDEKQITEAGDQIKQSLNESGYGKDVEVNLEKEGLRISIQSGILFDSGSADILTSFDPVILKIADTLRTLNNDIVVAGHSDNVPFVGNGKFHSNWDLSAARAISVMNFLVDQGKLDPSKFSIQAYAEYQPKVTNNTPEGRAENRRVELFIQRNPPKID